MNWTEKAITIDGPVKIADGYGHMCEGMILAFHRLGYDVHCTRWEQTDLTDVNPIVKDVFQRHSGGGPDVGVRLSQPDSFNICPSRFKVGYSMFEFTKIPMSWVPGANTVDLNMVPSEWCKGLWRARGVTAPVEANPLGVNEEVFTFLERPERDTFTFLMSGTMSERKAPWLAPKAFLAAFPGRKDVRLVLKSVWWLPLGPEYTGGDERITVINETWPDNRMVELMHAADCFIYPTRSEGFGLSPCEAMSTGLPVICTGETSCTEFMMPEHSYPLAITGWEDVPSDWGDIGGYTCPSLDHLIELMKYVDSHRDEAKEKGRKAAAFIRDRLTWGHNALRFIDIVRKYGT